MLPHDVYEPLVQKWSMIILLLVITIYDFQFSIKQPSQIFWQTKKWNKPPIKWCLMNHNECWFMGTDGSFGHKLLIIFSNKLDDHSRAEWRRVATGDGFIQLRQGLGPPCDVRFVGGSFAMTHKSGSYIYLQGLAVTHSSCSRVKTAGMKWGKKNIRDKHSYSNTGWWFQPLKGNW